MLYPFKGGHQIGLNIQNMACRYSVYSANTFGCKLVRIATVQLQTSGKGISIPGLGEVNTVGVGEEMVRQGKFVETEAILLSQPITVGAIGSYTFLPGHYTLIGRDQNSEFYLPQAGPDGGQVIMGALADPFEAIQLMSDMSEICGVSIFGSKSCENPVGVQRSLRPSLEANAFQQTLIYSGRVGTKINIGYREFSNDIARPSFNNDVEYDLTESNVIGYKGAEIEVMDATNRSITYRLIRNFRSN